MKRTLLIIVSLMVVAGAAFAHPHEYKTLLLGDSWAQAERDYSTFYTCWDFCGLYSWAPRGDYTAIGGTTAWWWALPAQLAVINNELAAFPSIDQVHVHLSGNDFLGGWNAAMTPEQENALFAAINVNCDIIIEDILNQRPNVKCAWGGYDYLNFVETLGNPSAMALWLLLGAPTPNRLNWALINMGYGTRVKCEEHAPRAQYVQNWGLMQWWFGYPGLGVPPGFWPAPGQAPGYNPWPGGNPDFPSPPEAMGSNGQDPIHLNATGYLFIGWNALTACLIDWTRQAWGPTPAMDATNVPRNQDLFWVPNASAVAHDVYFGTGGEYRGRTTATTYDTGWMAGNTHYWWKIDEVYGDSSVQGGWWWHFKTGS
ncbi:MAG TPA: hypothetical protein HPP77_06645 [Candidatus Hydrogenedentes bacterium]|nr:hypothetical protein [Candidatus Hydrogenedentota bacterium]